MRPPTPPARFGAARRVLALRWAPRLHDDLPEDAPGRELRGDLGHRQAARPFEWQIRFAENARHPMARKETKKHQVSGFLLVSAGYQEGSGAQGPRSHQPFSSCSKTGYDQILGRLVGSPSNPNYTARTNIGVLLGQIEGFPWAMMKNHQVNQESPSSFPPEQPKGTPMPRNVMVSTMVSLGE